ncbi:hypothetical protein AUEXF2481DRAFT_34392 [Aureobasidium subglaciale EXF-2481]|uniref:Secreted protein n=1 Tax=Aureobasidium subglaciale (strain EXF-2481) TaxID=1043005 RepID=A0A074YR91_AURSE|nr:uncharacterized protein AUEXF2481DRAFT_34392 [Aureobasidium subglaciale EXF-2481]KER00196.1 hypothetical protein AUEXF2481DRAFT_34392 [Aureobasidium subglaciale EXF-2481]
MGLVGNSNWALLLSLSALNRCSASSLVRARLQYSRVWASSANAEILIRQSTISLSNIQGSSLEHLIHAFRLLSLVWQTQLAAHSVNEHRTQPEPHLLISGAGSGYRTLPSQFKKVRVVSTAT